MPSHKTKPYDIVSREEICHKCKKGWGGCDIPPVICKGCAVSKVKRFEATKVQHGHWIDDKEKDWKCSRCKRGVKFIFGIDGITKNNLPRFCPNCGTMMDRPLERR